MKAGSFPRAPPAGTASVSPRVISGKGSPGPPLLPARLGAAGSATASSFHHLHHSGDVLGEVFFPTRAALGHSLPMHTAERLTVNRHYMKGRLQSQRQECSTNIPYLAALEDAFFPPQSFQGPALVSTKQIRAQLHQNSRATDEPLTKPARSELPLPSLGSRWPFLSPLLFLYTGTISYYLGSSPSV